MSRDVFKENFCKAYNTSEEIVGFRKRQTTVEQEEKEIQEALDKRKKADIQKTIEMEKEQKLMALNQWRDKKKAHTREKV